MRSPMAVPAATRVRVSLSSMLSMVTPSSCGWLQAPARFRCIAAQRFRGHSVQRNAGAAAADPSEISVLEVLTEVLVLGVDQAKEHRLLAWHAGNRCFREQGARHLFYDAERAAGPGPDLVDGALVGAVFLRPEKATSEADRALRHRVRLPDNVVVFHETLDALHFLRPCC